MNRVCMLVRELFLLKKDLSFLGISWRTIIYRKYDKFHVKIQPERIYVRELSEGTFRVLLFFPLIFFYFFFFFIQYLPMDIEPFSYFFFFFILWWTIYMMCMIFRLRKINEISKIIFINELLHFVRLREII